LVKEVDLGSGLARLEQDSRLGVASVLKFSTLSMEREGGLGGRKKS